MRKHNLRCAALLAVLCITISFVKGDCVEEEVRYKESSIWRRDSCNVCTCKNNVIICHKVTCKNPYCDTTKGESLYLPANSCCPECTTNRGNHCTKDGKVVAHNAQWKGENCTDCTCNNGAILCTPVTCDLDLQCGYGELPWKRPGECCSKCVSNGKTCEYNGETYRDGNSWSPSRCERAMCNNGEIVYQIAGCSPLVCPPGQQAITDPDQCCPQCVGAACTVEGNEYKSGDHFQLDSCRYCSCNNGEVMCYTKECDVTNGDSLDGDAKQCPRGKSLQTREGSCCPECLSTEAYCEQNDIRHYHGELWNASDCQVCACSRGTVKCFDLQCSVVKCKWNEKLVHKSDSCCPECVPVMLQCKHNELFYLHGDEWQISPCERCACMRGVTQCFTADCSPCPKHTVPVSVPGECCSTCEPVKCHADCDTCFGTGYGQCTTCKNTRHLLQEGKCVRRCLPGFYKEGTHCKRCHSSCESCKVANSPSTCTSCKPPLQLQDGSCVEDCIQGYFDDDGLCKSCTKGCKRCLSTTVCVECRNQTMLVQNGDCVGKCGDEFYYADGICIPCHPSCATCSTSSTICDSCPPHKMMQNGLCVTECSEKFYKGSEHTCEACFESCASCTGPSTTQCTFCVDNTFLHNGECLSECPPGYYGSNGVCQACDSTCQLCVGGSASDCIVCASTNQMIQPSSVSSPIGQCVDTCGDGRYPLNKLCMSCHESCTTCDGPTNSNCSSCDENNFILMTSQSKRMCLSEDECWVLDLEADIVTKQCLDKAELDECNKMRRSLVLTLNTNDNLDIEKCVKVCPKGTFKTESSMGSLCVQCASGCASCSSNEQCIECADDKVLSKLTSQCVDSCEDGYYEGRSGRCESCPASCVTCEVPEGGGLPRCTSCKERSTVLQFGECVKDCAEQFYADVEGSHIGTAVCRECDWTCNRCNGAESNQCLECMPESKLQQGSCLKQCTKGFYESSNECLPCKISHCISCNQENSCEQCKTPYHLYDNKCVASCPRGFVPDPFTNECVSCPAHCLRCSTPYTCDQCDGQTFMVANSDELHEARTSICTTTCKAGYYGNEQTRQCQVNNAPPVMSILKPIVVTIGQRALIDDRIMNISDADSNRDQLSLILEMEPGNGWIEIDNIRVRTGGRIPVMKVSQGRVWFVHDSALQRHGMAEFKCTDGHLESPLSNLDILIVSSSAPVVTKNKLLVVSAGESGTISSDSILEIQDIDNPEDVAITIMAAPKYGHVISSAEMDTEVLEFGLKDLDSGSLKYSTNKGGNFLSTHYDVISLQVSDGYYIINVAVRIQIVPKRTSTPSLVTNQAGRVRSRGLLQITNTLLQTVAENIKDKSKLVYILKPVNFTSGEVVQISPMSSDAPMYISEDWIKMEENLYQSPPVMSFSQEDIDSGNIWYRDLGGHDQVNAFNFEVLDENFKPPRRVADDIFRVSVVPDNSVEPKVARGVNFPPQMTANENRITVLHSGYIRYTDDDTPDRDLIYNITKPISPFFGTIEHADHPYVPITVFTQSDIDSNKIMFRPYLSEMTDITDEIIMEDDYDDIMDENVNFEEFGYNQYREDRYEELTLETRSMPDELQFDYTVSDGQHTLEPSTFTIKIMDQANTAGPTFTNPHPRIDVTQGGTAPIGESQLSVDDPDTHPRDLIFTLVKRPRHGSVIRNDRGMRIMLREGDSFTHDEVQRNSLQYVHDGSVDGLTDQLQVSVTDVTHTAAKVIQVIVLETDSSGPSPDLSTELSLVLNEGSVATLTRANLAYVDNDSTDAEITYTVLSPELQHGILDSEVLGDIMPGDSFTQEDINLGNIKYRSRDDAGHKPLTDELAFFVINKNGNKLMNQVLTITVTPGDNQAPTVSIGTGIHVDEGSSVLVTPRDIMATDADTPKDELIITIIRKPIYGYFLNMMRSDALSADDDELWFTMQDILDGAIYYVQSLHRHSEPTLDFFKFDVSDGHNTSPTYGLNITIHPTNDEEPVLQTKAIVCENGHATMILNASILVDDEDTASNELEFTVTSLPRHGSLVKFSEKMSHDVMNKWKMTGNNALQLDMMEKKKLMKLRVGSVFTYQDVIDGLICFESEGYTSGSSVVHRRRRETFGFILSDGYHETPGSLNIDVEPTALEEEEFDTLPEDLAELELDVEEEVVSYTALATPEIDVNTGISVEKGTTTVITHENLRASDEGLENAPRYVVVRQPSVGYLQLSKDRFAINITSGGESVFMQQDIDEGMLKYVHPENQPGGNFNFLFNVVGSSGSTLPEQMFTITVKDDRKPPVIRVNDGITVEESSSKKITSDKLAASDEVTSDQLLYTITTPPKMGQVEFIEQPGHVIRSFTQSDIDANRVVYVHTNEEEEQLNDQFEFSLSDGANAVSQTFLITVLPIDNSLPYLTNTGIRVQEGVRKTITEFELKAVDKDTKNDLVTFTVHIAPHRGAIERTNHRGRYVPVSSFTMDDIHQSRISYNHDGSNSVKDRFTFTVGDGTNSDFIVTVDGVATATSAHQEFNITILPVDDGTPRLVVNLGLHHLEYEDGQAMGSISKTKLFTEDPDTSADMITYTLTSEPRHGHIESSTNAGRPIKSFTQEEINSGTIRYVLADAEIEETRDSFMFNVRDSMPNVVTGNVFHIRWSVFTLDKAAYTVKEEAGQIDVLIRRHGSLDYAIVLCRTESGTATSVTSNEKGSLDYVEYAGQVQFDENEDEKVCSIEIKNDKVYEGDEQFTVVIAMPNYALLGAITETVVTIDDFQDMPTFEIEDSEYEVQENDDVVFVQVKRTGDIDKAVSVICHTESGTATGSSVTGGILSGADYKSRDVVGAANKVFFAPGIATATCDIKLIDDSIYEENEDFVVRLIDPSTRARVGEQSNATITIVGPNDAPSVFFSDEQYEFSENEATVDVTVVRSGSDLSQPTDVWCSTRATTPVSAVPGEDFVQSSNKVTFQTGETTKVCSMMILDDSQAPSLEGNEAFEVYLSSVLRAKLVKPHVSTVTINDTMDDIPTMEFEKTEVEVKEKDKVVSLAIKREGDVSSTSSVICYTRRDSAYPEDDFNERANTEISRIVFKPGQKVAECNVTINNDNEFESTEKFTVHLGSAIGSEWYGARIGEKKHVAITITNDEDAPTIMFERAEYSIREPDREERRQLVVKVIRTGDTSEVSKVRCSTRDGSATSASDYEPRSRMLRFQPGETEVIFRVNILPNEDTEWHENFLLVLGPDDPVNAVLGPISQATVTVLDKDAAGSLVLPTTPVVVSLLHYDEVKTGLDIDPSPGYPLVCVTPCDPRYPDYVDTRNLCEEAGINASAIAFSWEVAMPTNIEGGGSHPFVKVQDDTPFTSVNTKVLDSIYFSRRFHVRCIAQAVDSVTGTGGTPLRSNVATIGTDTGLCHEAIVAGAERGFQAQSFIAKLDYIPPTSKEHPNTLQISVEIPHQDGRLPLISTMPFNNLKLLLSRSIDRQQHLCSNMMYSGKTINIKASDLVSEGEEEDFGKYLGFIEPTDYSKLSLGPGFDKPFQLDPSVREAKSIDLYKYLNLKSCVWRFTAHYKMNQLIDYCNGKVDTDYQLRDAKSLVTVSVPLHVSYIYVTAPTGWGALEHRTEMQFSFVYDSVVWTGGIQTEGDMSARLRVKKMRIRDDGRLEINFETKTQFRGLFVLQHHTLPGTESAVVAPDELNLDFILENVWNENTFDQPHQQWRAVSKYSKKDYSGDYEIVLVPCTVTPTVQWKPTEKGSEPSCTAFRPEKFKIPITFQQTNRPVAVTYSLNTAFQLSNNEKMFVMDPSKGQDNELDYKGAFSKGQTIFGRVLWNPDQNLHSAYKLQLEKVYLCSGRDGYIPTFDPDGSEYLQGPQYGCIQPSKNLQQRFLLLDRTNRDGEDKYFHDVPFDAYFASDRDEFDVMSEIPGVDGFMIKVDALYKVAAGHQWYIQVMYAIGPDDVMKSRARRSVAMYGVDLRRQKRSFGSEDEIEVESFKNGTNMRTLVIAEEEGLPTGVIAGVVVAVLIPLFLCCCCFAVCCCRRRRRREKKEVDEPKKSIVVAEYRDQFVKKCVDDDDDDDVTSGESCPLSGHKRSSSNGLVTVVSLPKKVEKNYIVRRDVNINDVELQPLKQNNRAVSKNKKKNIPIVNNLRMNNDEDGTEV